MKKKAEVLLDQVTAMYDPLDKDVIHTAFEKKLAEFNLSELIHIDSVDIGPEGDIVVTFGDASEDTYALLFTYDEKEGPQAFAINPDDDIDAEEDEEDSGEDTDGDSELVSDLGAYNPSIIQTEFGPYINLGDLSWVDVSVMMTLLQIAGFCIDPVTFPSDTYDAFGNIVRNESINEIIVTRVIGGKKVRVQAVRRIRKRRLTSKQRAGIRRAVQKRKREKNQIARHRNKSLAVRKRLHLRPSHLPKGYKVRR